MSYNITGWDIGHVRLELPMDFDFVAWVRTLPDRDERGYENTGKRWCLEEIAEGIEIAPQIDTEARTWKLELLNQSLSGSIENNKLIVTDLDWRDDFSGHLYGDILLPLFQEYKGEMRAIVVWEGGDSVNRLSIQDGVIDEQKAR